MLVLSNLGIVLKVFVFIDLVLYVAVRLLIAAMESTNHASTPRSLSSWGSARKTAAYPAEVTETSSEALWAIRGPWGGVYCRPVSIFICESMGGREGLGESTYQGLSGVESHAVGQESYDVHADQ